MFLETRRHVVGEARILLRADLPSVRQGLIKVQQLDGHYAHTVRVPVFSGMPGSSKVLMATRVGRNSATMTGLLALSAQAPRKSECSRNAI